MINFSDAARAARNAYLREWRKKNRDKTKQAYIDFWERKADPVGGKIRLLHKQGMTQRQIAEAVGVSLGKVNEILKGDSLNTKLNTE